MFESAASNGSQVLVTFTDYSPTESVEIDAVTGALGTRSVIAGKIPAGPPRQHSAAVWSGSRWLIVREEPGVLEPDVFLDDVRMFTSAWAPRVAESGGIVIVVAIRDGQIVARAFENGADVANDGSPPVVLSAAREMHEPVLELGAEQRAGHPPEVCYGQGSEGGAVAAAGGNALIAWSAFSPTIKEVRFRIVNSSGATPDVLLDATDELHFVRGRPVAAANGSEFLVGWFSWASQTQYFNLARVSAEGVVRDPGGIRARGHAYGNDDTAALVWHRDHWIAAWRVDRAVYMRRLNADGTFMDDAPIYLGEAWWASSIQAVSNGRTALVTWSDGLAIRGVLFDESNGYRHVPAIASSAESYLASTASGTDGENYRVAYSCDVGCPENGAQSAIFQPRIWSIEIDGHSGGRSEPVPQPLSGLHPGGWRIADMASIADGSDWWGLRVETPDPYANWPVSDVYLGEERIFESAGAPMIARDGSFVIAAAWRGHEVVYRIGHVVE